MDGQALQSLLDRQQITDLIYRYCRAVDRLDAELGYSVWHEDGVADYRGIFQGAGRDFIDFVCTQHRKALAHSHQVTNILIELDGDRAASEAYVVSGLHFRQGEQIRQVTTWARYIDQWSRRNGQWGIDKRIAVRDIADIRDATSMPGEGGARDESDPSYSILGLNRRQR